MEGLWGFMEIHKSIMWKIIPTTHKSTRPCLQECHENNKAWHTISPAMDQGEMFQR